jgi:SAM-dependent methyltransferase
MVDTGGDLQLRVLESLEASRNYNGWIASMTRPYLGANPLEIGSGLGGNAGRWLAAGVPHITVSELNQQALTSLRERFAGDERVEVLQLDVLDPPERSHSAVVAINVLEHVERAVDALQGIRQLLAPGGCVVLFVPAFEAAMSRFDREIGHHRRYTVETLERAFAAAAFDVERCHYFNGPGLLAWFLGMRLLRMTPHDTVTLRAWDRLVVPIVRRIETWRPPPFGQSVFGVARLAA